MGQKAVVDIGSNSIRLVIYTVDKDFTFKIIDEEKRGIRLGSYLTENNYLSEEGIEKAINELKAFKLICDSYEDIEIYVVATEAIRRAVNRDIICCRVKEELGLDINILSGKKEAIYGYLAIKNSIVEDNAILLDLGGSSMEITLLQQGLIKETISLPLGCIPLTKRLDNFSGVCKKTELSNFIYKSLSEIPWLKENNKMNVIGIGGTARNIGKVSRKKTDYPIDLVHNYAISKEEMWKIYNDFSKLSVEERYRVKGLSKERIDIFEAPLCAILEVLKYCDSESFIVSEVGIRDGIMYESILNGKEIDVLDYSLLNLRKRLNINDNRNRLVYELAQKIVKVLDSDINENILKSVCALYDIGKDIGFKQKHTHSFYILSNSSIYGLSHKENIMVAFIVAAMWKKDFKLPKEFKSILKKEDIRECEKISMILYISYNFVRYINEEVKELSINEKNNIITFNIGDEKANYIRKKIDIDMREMCIQNFNKYLNFV